MIDEQLTCKICEKVLVPNSGRQRTCCSRVCANILRGRKKKLNWLNPDWKSSIIKKREIANKTLPARQNRSKARRDVWKNPTSRQKFLGSHWSRSSNRKSIIGSMSVKLKELAKTRPINQKKHMIEMAIKSHQNKKINKPEKKLLLILDRLFPGEFRWVGDLSLRIGNFFPDFVDNVQGDTLIELFGTYWHAYPAKYGLKEIVHSGLSAEQIQARDRERLHKYESEGFKVLVVWEHELKNRKLLEYKLREFNKQRSTKCVQHI